MMEETIYLKMFGSCLMNEVSFGSYLLIQKKMEETIYWKRLEFGSCLMIEESFGSWLMIQKKMEETIYWHAFAFFLEPSFQW